MQVKGANYTDCGPGVIDFYKVLANGRIVIKLSTLKHPNYTKKGSLLPIIISAFDKKSHVMLHANHCQNPNYGFRGITVLDQMEKPSGTCGPGRITYFKVLKNGHIKVKLDSLGVPNYTKKRSLLPVIMSALRERSEVMLTSCQLTDLRFGDISIIADKLGNKCGPGIIEW